MEEAERIKRIKAIEQSFNGETERDERGGYKVGFWQHHNPLKCPKGTPMVWLGSVYWICGRQCCNQIWCETPQAEAAVDPVSRVTSD